jgi:hypothetical protein
MGKGKMDASLELEVAGLQRELAKKATFEGAVASLTTMFRDNYQNSSPAEQRAVCCFPSFRSTFVIVRLIKCLWIP